MKSARAIAALYCSLFALSAAGTADRAEQLAAIDRAVQLLESNYVYPDRGRDLARKVRRAARAEGWAEVADPEAFARLFTEKLRAISGDGHFAVDYRAAPPANDAAEEAFGAEEFEKYYGVRVNHGFEQVRRLEGNVGFLDLRVFAPPSMGADMAVAAMTLLAQSDALIIDLRQNGGGDGALGLLIAGYLLDAPQAMSGTYDRPSDTLKSSHTPVWVPGRRFGGKKPVFILISKSTFSAAEAFAYDLQAARRVTVIGEPSGGGAHPFVYRSLSPHFMLSLPEGRSVNPITGKDWQGSGVIPDVRIPADQALDEALRRARAVIEAGQSTTRTE